MKDFESAPEIRLKAFHLWLTSWLVVFFWGSKKRGFFLLHGTVPKLDLIYYVAPRD